MKILGIGNAIVDVICKIDDNFLSKNELIKSTMKLVDEKEVWLEKTTTNNSVAKNKRILLAAKNRLEKYKKSLKIVYY